METAKFFDEYDSLDKSEYSPYDFSNLGEYATGKAETYSAKFELSNATKWQLEVHVPSLDLADHPRAASALRRAAQLIHLALGQAGFKVEVAGKRDGSGVVYAVTCRQNAQLIMKQAYDQMRAELFPYIDAGQVEIKYSDRTYSYSEI